MAEHLLRRMLAEQSRTDVQVRSAGTAVTPGILFPEEARQALEQERVTRITHTAQNISTELVRWSDLILTMEAHHKRAVVERFPDAAMKTHVLNAHAGLGGETAGIRDPYGGPLPMYESALAQIKRALQKILSTI